MNVTSPPISQPRFDRQRLAALTASVAGPVLSPGDDGFAAECAGFNLLVHHQPALIVGATSESDVQSAVRFAVEHGLPVAVHATGHQPFAPANGSLLITTGRMDSVEIDFERPTARIGAGARWGEVVDKTAPFGLAPLNGSSSEVAVAGYVLGGGLSPVMGRTFGWAADHVQAIDMVTADGELRHVTSASDPDLFWAVRGGKSNFGVVTALELDLFSVAEFFGGGLFYAGEHTAEVLHAYRELVGQAPEALNSSVALLRLPPLPFVPEPLRGGLVVHVRISYLGSTEEGEKLVAPLRAVAPTIIDTVGETPYKDFASLHQDPVDPMPYQERGALLNELTAGGVDALVEMAGPNSGCQMTMIEVRHLGGALARPAKVPNAVGHRDASFTVWGAVAGGPEEISVAVAQMDAILARLEPWGNGGKYLNFMSGADPVEAAYPAEIYARLQAVKRAYDPGNVFRLNNHNILPQA